MEIKRLCYEITSTRIKRKQIITHDNFKRVEKSYHTFWLSISFLFEKKISVT